MDLADDLSRINKAGIRVGSHNPQMALGVA